MAESRRHKPRVKHRTDHNAAHHPAAAAQNFAPSSFLCRIDLGGLDSYDVLGAGDGGGGGGLVRGGGKQ